MENSFYLANKNLKIAEVRNVGHNQDKQMVYFHLLDNTTIACRTTTLEIAEGNNIRNQQGEDARKSYWVNLFNLKHFA